MKWSKNVPNEFIGSSLSRSRAHHHTYTPIESHTYRPFSFTLSLTNGHTHTRAHIWRSSTGKPFKWTCSHFSSCPLSVPGPASFTHYARMGWIFQLLFFFLLLFQFVCFVNSIRLLFHSILVIFFLPARAHPFLHCVSLCLFLTHCFAFYLLAIAHD